MASSTLIFSRWILPFLFSLSFSFSLPLFDSFLIEDIETTKKVEASEKSRQPLRPPDDRFEHNVDRDTRLWLQRQWYFTKTWKDRSTRHLLPCRASDTRVSRTRKNRVGDPERPDSREIARVCAIQPRPRRWPSIVAFPFSWLTVPAHLDHRSSLSQGWSLDFSLTGWALSWDFSDEEISNWFCFLYFLMSIV